MTLRAVNLPICVLAMENPLQGTLNRERTVLVFAQRSREVVAAWCAVALGGVMVLVGFLQTVFGLQLVGMPTWFLFFGCAFAFAGAWAILLFRQLKFDLRKRTYTDRMGLGMQVIWRRGTIDEVHSVQIFLQSQIGGRALVAGDPAGLSLRLWWRDPEHPTAVIEQRSSLTAGAVRFETAHGEFIQRAKYYGTALGVPVVDSLQGNRVV